MFSNKIKTEMQQEKTNAGTATLIGAGTTLKGDISSNSDLRIDGTVIGNIHSAAKIIIGSRIIGIINNINVYPALIKIISQVFCIKTFVFPASH